MALFIPSVRRYSRPTVPLPPLSAAAEAVLTFLESAGRRSEAELYLELFQKLPKQSFAIVCPAAPVVRQGAHALVEQLRFLADLGLSATVVLGLFDPPSAEALAERFLRRLTAAGLEPVSCSPDAADRAAAEIALGRTPVVRFAAEGPATIEARFGALAALARELGTQKLVIVRTRGALRIASDRREATALAQRLAVESGALSLVNLRTDADRLLDQRLLRREDAELLRLVRGFLAEALPAPTLVSVTSALGLLTELFTVKGAGTLIQRGSAIARFAAYAELDQTRLSALLASSFGRELRPALFGRVPLAIYVEERYRGAAIVEPASVAPYLSKFAVEPAAQGEGMGRDLWQALERDFDRLFWRTRATNPVSSWYAGICDGLVRTPQWHVFWRGIEPGAIEGVVRAALEPPDDFEPG
jgi:bifunctional N-acetylglutamate synthase/kinase